MLLTEGQVPLALRIKFGLPEAPIMAEMAESAGIKDVNRNWPGGIISYDLSLVVKAEHATLVRNTLDQLEKNLTAASSSEKQSQFDTSN